MEDLSYLKLNRVERDALTRLADSSRRGQFNYPGLILASDVGTQISELEGLIGLLTKKGLIKYFPENYHIIIEEGLIEFQHAVENPPPRDFRVEWETWFHSKPWSVPIRLLFIGLPALVGYVAMLQVLLKWVGVTE